MSNKSETLKTVTLRVANKRKGKMPISKTQSIIRDNFKGDVKYWFSTLKDVFNNTEIGLKILLILLEDNPELKDVIKIESGEPHLYDPKKKGFVRCTPHNGVKNVFTFFEQMIIEGKTDNAFDLAMMRKASKYLMLGNDYFENDYLHEAIKKSTILDREGTTKLLPYIDRFKGVNVYPSYPSVKNSVGNDFNLFRPWPYKASLKPGEFPTIEKILNHVFKQDIDFGYDYFQLLITEPTQRLPIVVLSSVERGTGKSTIMELCEKMFGENYKSLNVASYLNKFNYYWRASRIAIIDEAVLNGKAVMNKIKSESTSTTIITELKFGASRNLNNYLSLMLINNNPDSFAEVEKNEDRLVIFKLKPFDKGEMIIDIMKQKGINKEIENFLHFLENRKMYYPKKGRFYFDLSVYNNQNLRNLVRKSAPLSVERIIEMILDRPGKKFAGNRLALTDAVNRFEERDTIYSGGDLNEIKRGSLQGKLITSSEINEALNWAQIESSRKKSVRVQGMPTKYVYSISVDEEGSLIDKK